MILSPAWVAKYVLGIEGTINVTIQGQLQANGGQTLAAPSYAMPGLTYSVLPNALILSGVKADRAGLDRLQEVARTILGVLPHTPISAVGYNVAFEADDPDPQLDFFRSAQVALVDLAPDGWAAASNMVTVSLSKDDDQINIDRAFAEGKALIRFNFHMPAPTSAAALEVLGRKSFFESFQSAERIAGQISQEGLTS